MPTKPTYEELEHRLKELENQAIRREPVEVHPQEFVGLSPNLIGSGNLNGYFTQINSSVKKMLGYSQNEFCGKPFLEFIHTDDKRKTKRALAKAIEGKQDIRIENRYKCKNGSYKWIDWHVFAVMQKDKFFAIGIDITDRKLAEASLRESEEHFRSLLESASNFAVYRLAYDESRSHKLKVVFVSSSIKDILGIPKPMEFESWFDNIHPDDVMKIAGANQKAFETMRFDEKYRNFNPQKGEWGWIHAISTGGRDENGWNQHVNGIMIDITEKQEALEELKRHEKELQDKSNSLLEMNAALNVLIKKMEKEEEHFQQKIVANLQQLVFPYLKKIKRSNLDGTQQTLLNIIQSNLKKLTENFSHQLASNYYGLTSTEVEVSDLVRQGKKTKEIADILNISHKTVESHRGRIRKKLGIGNEKVNLRTYLLSIK